jgi:hypothetical protein
MLFFGSIQNDSFTKRPKISRGKMGVRSIGSTFGRTVCRPGHADPRIELVRVVGNVVEVMFEPGFADELVDRAHGRRRIARQAFVGQQQQVARRILAIERILGGLEGEPHHAARIGQRLDARVHRGIGVEPEHLADADRLPAHQPFHAVQHPGQLANARDDLRLRKQSLQQLHPAAPQPAGVEHDAGVRLSRVEVLDQAAQHATRCSSETSNEKSFLLLASAITTPMMSASGLVMPARKRGFWLRMAARSVLPERGIPEMKWNFGLTSRREVRQAWGRLLIRRPGRPLGSTSATGTERSIRSPRRPATPRPAARNAPSR